MIFPYILRLIQSSPTTLLPWHAVHITLITHICLFCPVYHKFLKIDLDDYPGQFLVCVTEKTRSGRAKWLTHNSTDSWWSDDQNLAVQNKFSGLLPHSSTKVLVLAERLVPGLYPVHHYWCLNQCCQDYLKGTSLLRGFAHLFPLLIEWDMS